jgi:predicted TIM-barrel fold metal-dependent hydrolase
MLRLTQELEFPIHIQHRHHRQDRPRPGPQPGSLLLLPHAHNDTYYRSRIVFLHCSYPNTRNVAVMANTYPYIWADMAQVLPWASLNFAQIVEEIIGMAPNSKIMFGTGSHNHPELIWMSSKIAKSALEFVMENAVKRSVLTKPQAVETAEQLLYKNALRLYGEK